MLIDLKTEVDQARATGQTQLSPQCLSRYEHHYQQLIEQGLLLNPKPPPKPKGKRGRVAQSKAKNLLDRLERHKAEVLKFAFRFDVPFDNNQAERDIRMVKVQQKVSGCFRSESGAVYWCRIRGYLSTMRKQGENVLVALTNTFKGQAPLPTILA